MANRGRPAPSRSSPPHAPPGSRKASDESTVRRAPTGQDVAMHDSRCTVVVATRDRQDQLAATLPRHLALPERARVVVVDDGSSEPVVAPGADLLRLSRGAGGGARNTGARAADTPY